MTPPPRRLAWSVVVAATALATVWAIANLLTGAAKATLRTPAPAAAAMPAAAGPPADVTQGRHWADPSLDPDILRRAYAPVSKPLPPEARPKAQRLMPSAREWRRLDREDATLY
jgi:hypothetical protein